MDDETKQPWTQGEWEMTTWDVEVLENGEERGGEGYSIEASRPYKYLAEVVGVDEESQANGKLMAAAPVLAKALADMVTAFEGTQQAPDNGSSVRWVRLIIASEKARDALELCGWKWALEDAESERDRLAVDAMTALIAADICTPERGYVAEPVCLTMDIGKLARERDEARAAVAELVDLVRRDVEMSGKECWEYAKGAARGQSTCTHPKCAWLHDARAALAKAKEETR